MLLPISDTLSGRNLLLGAVVEKTYTIQLTFEIALLP